MNISTEQNDFESSQLSLLADAPKGLRERIALLDGELHISEELRGNGDLLSFVSLARRQGISSINWHAPAVFERQCRHGVHLPKTESEIQAYAVKLLQTARNNDASDVHIIDNGSYGIIQFRRLGMLQDYTQLQGDTIQKLIRAIYQTMSDSASAQFSPTERQDGRIVQRNWLPRDVHSVRMHTEPLECSTAKGGVGTGMFLRLLYDRTEAKGRLEERLGVLGYSSLDAYKIRFLTERNGLNIIAGPTGHGKSTLLKHVMEAMALHHPEKNFSSIEDPPEFPLDRVKQILVNTGGAAAMDTRLRGILYMNAIAGAMRSDPDGMMIGEIRYPEAAWAAIEAALTGHGVWATIHAHSAFGVIKRMMSLLRSANVDDPLEYLCDHHVVAGIIYQHLVPKLCPRCKIPRSDVRADKSHADLVFPDDVDNRLQYVLDDLSNVYVRGHGCDACKKLGISGQTVAGEIVVTDQKLLQLIAEKEYQEANEYWVSRQGGRTYVRHALDLIAAGIADPYLTEKRLGVPLNFDKVFEEFSMSEDKIHELTGVSHV